MGDNAEEMQKLQDAIVRCCRCPRLVAWREKVAREKVRRFAEDSYWGKPIPSLGDRQARLLIVGLAPAAHGGNRTGRMFTGDRSGDWLFSTLYKFGFANQPNSSDLNDGLVLKDCYITAALHCAPPQNKPTAEERKNCFAFFLRELDLLRQVKVVVPLGKIAFDCVLEAFKRLDRAKFSRRPAFGHAVELLLHADTTLIASFHPSQQNTFTGRLTRPMFETVFEKARRLLEAT
ncbi:MAG: uracil-DNA glycosylase [bacterium]